MGRDTDRFRLAAVDDEPTMCELVVLFAGEAGFEARSWTSVAAFKDDCAGFTPDLVVSDIVMPGQDGIELIGHLADNGYEGLLMLISRFHQIYLSGAEEIADARGLRRLPSLAKPIGEEVLASALADAMAILTGELT